MHSMIFENEERGCKVLALDCGGFTEYYMQANSSDWFFCVAVKTPFSEATREYIETIMDEYYPLVADDEEYLEKKRQNDW